MSNFYQVYYDIQNTPSEEISYISSSSSSENEPEETTIYMNHNNPYLTPKYSYVNPNSILLQQNSMNDENDDPNHNNQRKRCRIMFDSPFSKKNKKNKLKNLFNTSLTNENKENNIISNHKNDDNESTHSDISIFSFRPDLIEDSYFNNKTPDETIISKKKKSSEKDDLVYSDISDDEL